MQLEKLKEHNKLYQEFDTKFAKLLEDFGAVAGFANENVEEAGNCYQLENISDVLETFKDMREVFVEAMGDRYDLIIELKK